MQTSSWGPVGWEYLHTVSFNYPIDPEEYDRLNEQPIGSTRQKYKDFFIQVGETLPCKYCRTSYREFIKDNPIRLDSRDEITKWLYEIHDMVNQKIGKKSIPFEDVKKKFESFRADCSAKVATGCIKPLMDRVPTRCYVIHTKCTPFMTHFFATIVILFLLRIIYKKGKIYKMLN